MSNALLAPPLTNSYALRMDTLGNLRPIGDNAWGVPAEAEAHARRIGAVGYRVRDLTNGTATDFIF